MSQATFVERLETLEIQVAELMARAQSQKAEKNWRRTVGMFEGDPIMQEIQEEGRKIRDEDREQAQFDHSWLH